MSSVAAPLLLPPLPLPPLPPLPPPPPPPAMLVLISLLLLLLAAWCRILICLSLLDQRDDNTSRVSTLILSKIAWRRSLAPMEAVSHLETA